MKLFRLWLGITEYVYRNEELLNECIETGLTDNTFVSDDLEFTFAARVSFRPANETQSVLTCSRTGASEYP